MAKHLRTVGTALLAIVSCACVAARLPAFSAESTALAAADFALPLGFYREATDSCSQVVPENPPASSQTQSGSPSSTGTASSQSPASSKGGASSAVSETASGPTEPLEDTMLDGQILETDISEGGSNQAGIFVKDASESHDMDAAQVLEQTPPLNIKKDGTPMVLLYHTHTCEAYADVTSSKDPTQSVVAVGEAIKAQLEAAGIGVIHDTTIHDSPNYNGCYDRSGDTVRKNLEQYPSIQVALDIHRDSMTTESGTRYKPTALINGKRAAQIMIISGCDDGTLDYPNWEENLKLAVRLQSGANAFPRLMRPLDFIDRRYNQQLTYGSLLCEFGTEVNTLEEAVYSGELFGKVLAGELGKLAQ